METNSGEQDNKKLTNLAQSVKELNSKKCMQCAKCCARFWIFTTDPDEAMRFHWLDTNKIKVKELIPEKQWVIQFNIPCKELEKTRTGYRCKVHEGLRPGFCKDYPLNFLSNAEVPKEVLDNEILNCPELKRIVESYKP